MADSINSAVSAEEQQRLKEQQDQRDAIFRAINQVKADEETKALLRDLLAKQFASTKFVTTFIGKDDLADIRANIDLAIQNSKRGNLVGEVISYRFSTIPEGYLLLDGSTYNFDDYPELGGLYGASEGGTFTVDDWRGVPLYGADGNTGAVQGEDTLELSLTAQPSETAVVSATLGIPSLLQETNTLEAASADHTHAVADIVIDKRPRRAFVNWLIRAF